MGTEQAGDEAATILVRIDWRVASAQIALLRTIHHAVTAMGTQNTTRWATAVAAAIDSGVTFLSARIQFTICRTEAGLTVECTVVASFTVSRVHDAVAARGLNANQLARPARNRAMVAGFNGTLARAPIAVHKIAVIASLRPFKLLIAANDGDDAAAAKTWICVFDLAVLVASIAIDQVTVITLFSAIDAPIATDRCASAAAHAARYRPAVG